MSITGGFRKVARDREIGISVPDGLRDVEPASPRDYEDRVLRLGLAFQCVITSVVIVACLGSPWYGVRARIGCGLSVGGGCGADVQGRVPHDANALDGSSLTIGSGIASQSLLTGAIVGLAVTAMVLMGGRRRFVVLTAAFASVAAAAACLIATSLPSELGEPAGPGFALGRIAAGLCLATVLSANALCRQSRNVAHPREPNPRTKSILVP